MQNVHTQATLNSFIWVLRGGRAVNCSAVSVKNDTASIIRQRNFAFQFSGCRDRRMGVMSAAGRTLRLWLQGAAVIAGKAGG